MNSRARRVDVWSRVGPSEWRVVTYTDREVAVPGVDDPVPMDELYEGWTEPPAPVDTPPQRSP